MKRPYGIVRRGLTAAAILTWLVGLALIPSCARGWELSGHAPLWGMQGYGCQPDTTHPSQIVAVILYRFGQQSQTWVAKRDSMLVFPDVWTRHWPAVVVEASPKQYMSVACSRGAPFSFDIPDTSRQWAYYVVGRTDGHAEGRCWGRIISRP